MVIMYIMAFTSGSFVIYSFDYLILEPSYLCQNSPESQFESCTTQAICQARDDGTNLRYQIDWSNSMSIINWVEQLDLLCKYHHNDVILL